MIATFVFYSSAGKCTPAVDHGQFMDNRPAAAIQRTNRSEPTVRKLTACEVARGGIEPSTPRFSVACSTN